MVIRMEYSLPFVAASKVKKLRFDATQTLQVHLPKPLGSKDSYFFQAFGPKDLPILDF